MGKRGVAPPRLTMQGLESGRGSAMGESELLLEELQRIRVTLEGVRVSLSTLTEIGADHERRLRAVEGRQQSWAPVLAAAVFVAGVCTTLLFEWNVRAFAERGRPDATAEGER